MKRFWSKVTTNRETGCWEWIGARNSRGRAVWSIQSRAVLAYRVAWEHFCGPIPDGMTVDHLCGSRTCINPEHLEIVTRSLNSHRGTPSVPLRTDPDRPRFIRPVVQLETRQVGYCRHGHNLTEPGAFTVARRGEICCIRCRRERRLAKSA